MKISLKREDLLDLQISLKKEYLLTNGKGGYCSSTVHDCHIRKYHGLLILPFQENGQMINYLSKLEAKVVVDNLEFNLATNKFPNVYHPTGHKYVESFELEQYPVTTYRIGDAIITKSIVMPYGEDSVLVRYDVKKCDKPVLFKVTPLFAFRDIHSLSKRNLDIKPKTYFEPNGFKFDPYKGLPPVFLQTSSSSVFYSSPEWWANFELLKERNRGYEYHEDLFAPGVFEIKIKEGDSVIFRASLNSAKKNIEDEWDQEVRRLQNEFDKFKEESEPLKTLKTQGSKFLIKTKNGEIGIKAGYHWFGERGRDSFISLPGLTWLRGDIESAKSILKKYALLEKNGLFPELLNNTHKDSKGAIDTSFLYFRAVQQFLEFTKDRDFIEKELLSTLVNIVSSVLKGRMPNAWLSIEGFIYSAECMNWMDTRINGTAVTPRNGATVEINALWYNALCFLLHDFKSQIGEDLNADLTTIKINFESHFENMFWNEPDHCLYDFIQGHDYKNHFIRPNQLFAIGLPYSCISHENAIKILKTVEAHLVTPYGLRTLSPRNPLYRSEYKGDYKIRDAAYHNGMVWPWLIGIYSDALLKYYNSTDNIKEFILETFNEALSIHYQMYGLLCISELSRPNPPYVSKACIAQAWSEAEYIRVLELLKN